MPVKESVMSELRLGAAALLLTTLGLAACSPGTDEPPAKSAKPANAAAASAPAQPVDTSKLDNPKPLPGDVSLPLPCGGELVLRSVYVLAQGSLDDREVNLGYP